MISEEAVDLDQKPSIKKRMLVGGFLALAAIGTHWLPGRTIVPTAPESQQAVVTVAADKMVTGPNSLLGDAVVDPAAQLLATTDMCESHLDLAGAVDQAGMSRLLAGADTNSGELAVPAFNTADQSSTNAGAIGVATAVPEPRTAGILLLAAAPVLIRRKGRAPAAA